MVIDYGQGEREIKCSVYTLLVYEQEFKSDMVKDLFGKVQLGEDDDGQYIDFTQNNWTASLKALWAMEKTASTRPMPPFAQWSMTIGDVDILKIPNAVIQEAQRGLFRSGATVSD